MDASTASLDLPTGHDQSKPPAASDSETSLSNHQGKLDTFTFQTLNGGQTMNSHNSGSTAPVAGTAMTSVPSDSSTDVPVPVVTGGTVLSKGLANATMHQSTSSVIQTPFMNSPTVVASPQPASQAGGPTVTLVRPPVHIAESGVTLNENNNAGQTLVSNATSQIAQGVGVQTPLVNNGQSSALVSVSAGSHIIKAEAPKTIIQSAPQTALTSGGIGASRTSAPATVAGPGGIRALAPQMLAPRLPQSSPGQPNIQNIQLAPGMVLVRSETGQLLMIHQHALAQMQAQAQAQGAMAPRPSTPTSMPPGQAPGTPIMSRQVASSNIVQQSSPATTPVSATTALDRPPFQSSVALPAGMTLRTGTQSAGTAVTSVTASNETMENVKKCKNFLSTLIKLASSGKQSTETAANVRELVKDLLEGKLEAEDFTSRLYSELNSSPQPYLVPFLKRSLPALRQLTPDSAAFIQQSQLPQPAPAPAAITTNTVVPGRAGPRLATPVIRPQLQPGISKPGLMPAVTLQIQQQGAMLRPQAKTPAVTLRNQAPARVMIGQPPVQVKQHTVSMLRPTALPAPKQVSPAALSPTLKNKLKEAGGTFKDDDDINDVASMAGVNLSEESARILATNSELVGAVTRSCKDETFLSSSMLQRRILEIGKRFGITELGVEVVTFVSHATQQHLQNLLEKVSQVAKQRKINFKEEGCYEQSDDVRGQLKFFEQLDQLEKQRKEEQEREILLKAAKSRARQEDPEQLRLKQKAKEMQQQELAQMRQREANLTALAAIGPRKKRKILDSPSSSTAAEQGTGASSSLSGGTGSSGSRPARQRITRVNLRDLLFCLENERSSAHSHFLYKGFLK